MSVPILEGRDLRVVYGRQEVLNVPQAEVREREVLAIPSTPRAYVVQVVLWCLGVFVVKMRCLG